MILENNTIRGVNLIEVDSLMVENINPSYLSINGIVNIGSTASFNIGSQFLTSVQLEEMIKNYLLISYDKSINDAKILQLESDLNTIKEEFAVLKTTLEDQKWQEI